MERFDLRYVEARGDKQRVVMLHRALSGSFERFITLLSERQDGALPAWLASGSIDHVLDDLRRECAPME